jgi:Calcineurin-like phosphoesterase.
MSRRIFLLICCVLGQLASLGVAADLVSPAPADSFTIAVIPDTQMYVDPEGKRKASGDDLSNPIFSAIVQWIVNHKDEQNIVFVSHVGDIVDKNNHDQWKIARELMNVIHGKIPYGISVGNHDMTSAGDSSLFQQYFPRSSFEEFSWYGGSYENSSRGPRFSGNNANSYQLFSAGGLDFVFLHLECNAPDDVVEWANSVLQKHSDRKALITTHMGWGPLEKPKENKEYQTAQKGRMKWSKIHGEHGNSPQQLWEKCYSRHPNLVAVFSGDQSRSQAIHAATPGEHGNIIHEFLSDYMQATADGGWLRLYRFFPEENRVQAITVHPVKGTLCEGTKLLPDPKHHQFEASVQLTPEKN